MKKILSLLFAIIFVISFNVYAEDFSEVNNGKTFYYNIISSTSPYTVEVTYRSNSHNVYSDRYSGEVSIPDSVLYNGYYYRVIKIAPGAFYGCDGLTSVSIPNSVASIGYSAFSRCSGLESISIPNSVTSIGYSAFYDCIVLDSVIIPNSVTSMGSNAFFGCSSLNSISIGNSITNIGSCVFENCSSLTSISIPNSVTSIGNYAFRGCSALISIDIPYSVTIIGISAFEDCSGLTSLTIPNSVTSIENFAFFGCSGLTSLTIPNSITTINLQAFYGCSGLTSLTIPNSVTSIRDQAFKGCSGLSSLTIPDSVASIGDQAFDGCINLSSITIGESVNLIGVNAFYACNAIDTINYYAINCTNMNDNFRDKTSLLTINFGDSIKNIPNNAFYGCSSVENLIIPDSVISIGINAFRDMGSLINLRIGKSINNIKDSAFFNCGNISNIHIKANNPPIIYNNTFYNVDTNISITIPCLSLSLYQTANWWNSFSNYQGTKVLQHISSTICEDSVYTSFGASIDSAGIYTLVTGCDSIILTLVVNPIFDTTHLDTICQGQVYDNYGFDFIADTSGFYTLNLQTIKGCDSIINLFLIVNPIYSDTIFAEICEGETYSQNGFNKTTAGFYSLNLQTIKGCDSIINLSLIVNTIHNDTIFAEICEGDSYTLNGFNETTAGFYSQNLQSIKGYDSIVNLSLGILSPPTVGLEMVTVDKNNNIIVVWEKNEVVNHYNIYKEGNVINQYDLIATVPYDSSSMFIDTNSNPIIKPYVYKISTTDICELSPFHKTMHLTINQGIGNNWNLYWSPYDGVNYTTYNIYRGLNSFDSLEFLTSTAASSTSYTDIDVPSQIVYYQVEIINDTNEARKSGSLSIRSNIVTNNTIGLNDIQSENIITKLYPNPTSGKARLEIESINSEADVLLYDMFGRIIQRHKISKDTKKLDIDLSGDSKGVYSIRIVNDTINQTKKLIVQ